MFKSICMFIAMLAIAFGLSARTLATASAGDNWIGLTDEPCTLAVVKTMVPAALLDQFHKADTILNKQKFDACYINRGDVIVLIYEDGDVGQVPAGVFKDGKVL